jgi:inorganic pyrophosphatase
MDPAMSIASLPPLDRGSGHLHVIVETPKGSRNKFSFDEDQDVFRLAGVLPAGTVFPYDFGFVPSTRADDGDPLDVLVLMDEPVPVGCLVLSRVLGVIEAEQTDADDPYRNDRLVAVAVASYGHRQVTALADLPASALEEIEHFFESYNDFKGRQFKVVARSGPERARELVDEAAARCQNESSERDRRASGPRASR